MKKGVFIVIDGLGGSGKTTQLELLRGRLPKALYTKEPGGAPRAERIRAILKEGDGTPPDAMTDFFLFWAARAEHMAALIRPALSKGRVVFSDRFDSSTFAMQIRGDQQKNLEKFFWQTREATLGAYTPDCYIILDTASGTARSRRVGRKPGEDRFDEKSVAYQRRVRDGYIEFARKMKGHVVAANQGPDDTHGQIWKIVQNYL
jgi:dTMP kinase